MRRGSKQWLAGVLMGLAGLGLLEAPSLRAQGTEVPERGLQATGSYRLGEIETVNTKNGNVLLSVPLASLPPGRGGEPGFALTLNYNSKLWDLYARNEALSELPTNPPPGPGSTGPPPPPRRTQYKIHRELRRNFANPGWHYSYEYLVAVEDRTDYHPALRNTPTTPTPHHEVEDMKSWFIYKVWMVFPDGSARLFRPEGEADLNGCSDGCDDDYFQVHPSGWRLLDYGKGWRRLPGSTVSYYSVDGSYLRLDFEVDPSTVKATDRKDWEDNPWTLYFPDGRRVQGMGASANRLIDRNGNVTTISRIDDYGEAKKPAVVIRDAAGRIISVQTGAGENGETLVRQTGGGDATLTWKIAWSQVKPCRSYYVTPVYPAHLQSQETPGAARTSLSWARMSMVDWIEPPAQLGGSGNHRFTFRYNAEPLAAVCGDSPSGGLGEIASVRTPSGAGASYTYRWDYDPEASEAGNVVTSAEEALKNAITGKELAYSVAEAGRTSTVRERWEYDISPNFSAVVTAPDGGTTRENWDEQTGVLEKVERLEEVGDSLRVQEVTERVWGFNIPAVDPSTSTRTANPYVRTEYRTLATGSGRLSKTAVRTFAHDRNGNLTRADEHDWVDYGRVARRNGKPTGAAAGRLKRRTLHTYYASGVTDAYHRAASPPLLTARASTEIREGAGTRRSRREFRYDNPRTTGNLTRERIWDSGRGAASSPLTSGNSITVTHAYDQYGNRTSTTDGRGSRTVWSYGQVAGSGSDGFYPTAMVEGAGTGLARRMTYGYDFHTGQVTSRTDADNGVTTRTTVDAAGRPILVRGASGKTEESQTQRWYCDRERRMIVRSDLSGRAGSGQLVTVTDYDRLGREQLRRSYEGDAPPLPAGSNRNAHCTAYGSETAGIKVKTHYRYVRTGAAPGYYTWTSNPYRSTGEGTMGWTRTRQDQLGRVAEVGHFGGESRPSPGDAPTVGRTTTAYDAEFTTVTDPDGRKRRSRQDALGRLVRVDEPNGSGNLGSTGSPNQATPYAYDALDNLTLVSQGRQTRIFAYDSLSRLTQATNPESGTNRYRYDANGNLTLKRDARGVETTYGYDALDRLTRRSYSYRGTDPAVSLETTRVDYDYDDCGRYSKGRMCSVTARKGMTEVSRTAYADYDALGRVGESIQTTGGTAYRFSYAYDRAGNMISQTYPSGRVVETLYDGAGRVAGVRQEERPEVYRYYAGGAAGEADPIDYTAHGGIEQLRLGNGLREQRSYNRRLQPTRIELTGTESNNAARLRLDYSYGAVSNNGNVVSQQIRAGALNVTQRYNYDFLNRLKEATEAGSGTGWTQTYQYDRYGNRAVRAGASHGSHQALTPTALTSFSSRYNRLLGGAAYDAGGNLTRDWGGRSFRYDGDNRMVSFTDPGPGGINTSSTYSYDGEGRRVRRATGGVTTTYVYNLLGQLAAEYGGVVDRVPGTRYLTPDHLGSTRLVTDAQGEVLTRHDYLPFGEEIGTGYGNRGSVKGYTATRIDGPTQKFTGQERDGESGLDYFGARYYSGAGGRFTSPDLVNVTWKRLLDPGNTLNKYIYAANNPLLYVDPNGQDVTVFYRASTWWDPRDFGHILLAVTNQETGQVKFFDYYEQEPHETSTVKVNPDAARLADHAALTIRTTPEQSQAMIDAIEFLERNPPPYDAIRGSTCVGNCLDLLRLAGIEVDAILPAHTWTQLYLGYAARGQNRGRPRVRVPRRPGVDYGVPMSSLPEGTPTYYNLRILYSIANHQRRENPKPAKARVCVTVGGEETCWDEN